jgi:hypothetical protein
MNNTEVIKLIQDMVYLINELMPDEEYRGMYNIDEVLSDANKAVDFLRSNDNG